MRYRLLVSFGLGVASALVAMALYPVLTKKTSKMGPLLKSVIKGGLSLKEQLMGIYAESKEKFEDLVSEVKEETNKKR